MSRSLRVDIIKDRPRNRKKSSAYWRTVRRVQNQAVRRMKEVPDEKEIVKIAKELLYEKKD
jgi:hypothetical protein